MSIIRLDDFSGGITDLIFTDDPRQCQTCDNYLISKDRGLVTRPGFGFYDSNNPQIPAGSQRIGNLLKFEDELLIQSSTKLYKDFANLTGPGGSDVFLSGSTSNYVDFAEWNGHLIAVSDSFCLPSKIYKDNSGDFQVRTAGLPELSSDPTITPDANDAKTYLYRFIYFYSYNVRGIDYEDYGPYRQVEVENAPDMSGVGHYNVITQIPALTGSNYDQDNIKVKVYRTINNGVNFYYVGETGYTSGSYMDSFTDQVADADLIENLLMYTEGGAVENHQCPPAKFVTMANDIVWYANVQENGVNRFNRLRQSIQFDPDSCPETFYYDFDSEIVGLSSINNYPIVFCKSGKVYRVEGYADYLGRGGSVIRKIAEKAGCLSNNSIVETENGLYWAGKDGWYVTDGFAVTRLAEDENGQFKLYETYSPLTNTAAKQKRIFGAYDRKNRRVFWSMSGATDNETIYVFDQTFNAFTTISHEDSIPSAIFHDEEALVKADSNGYVFYMEDTNYTDKHIDSGASPSDWYEGTIICTWKHVAFDFEYPESTKWVNKVNMAAENLSNLDLQINSYDNGSVVAVPLKEIEYKDVMTWGSPDWIWRDTDAIWRDKREIIKTRRMKKSTPGVPGSIRTRYKQLELTNAYTIIDWSDNSTTCEIDGTAKTATLTDTDFAFPNNSEGYTLSFETDNYVEEYEITDLTLGPAGTVITVTVSDPNGTLQDGTAVKWQLNGYPKNQKYSIEAITYHFEVLTDKGSFYKTSEADGNS